MVEESIDTSNEVKKLESEIMMLNTRIELNNKQNAFNNTQIAKLMRTAGVDEQAREHAEKMKQDIVAKLVMDKMKDLVHSYWIQSNDWKNKIESLKSEVFENETKLHEAKLFYCKLLKAVCEFINFFTREAEKSALYHFVETTGFAFKTNSDLVLEQLEIIQPFLQAHKQMNKLLDQMVKRHGIGAVRIATCGSLSTTSIDDIGVEPKDRKTTPPLRIRLFDFPSEMFQSKDFDIQVKGTVEEVSRIKVNKVETPFLHACADFYGVATERFMEVKTTLANIERIEQDLIGQEIYFYYKTGDGNLERKGIVITHVERIHY